MNFISQVRIESKVFPGVFFVLNKMSEARRSQLRLRIAEPTSKIRNLLREMNKVEEQNPVLDDKPRSSESLDALMLLSDQMEELSATKINPQWLLWGCRGIEGLQIDGVDATPQTLIDSGPPALFMEIVDEIKRIAQLNGDEEKNSESPITSGVVMGGTKNGSSAATASSTDFSEPSTEIAGNISQS